MNTGPATVAAEHLQRQRLAAQLLQQVQHQPWAHDFFALMRRLDALHPQAPRTGQAQRPAQEPLRLAQAPELDFAPAPLQRLELRDNAAPRLSARFFGLLGPQGPMPTHFTEYVRERLHQHGDSASAHFLDLFHHRFLSLFYRAWAQAQPVVHADRAHDDRYLVWLGSATGLPMAADSPNGPNGPTPAAKPTGLPPHALAFQAGLLSTRSRHPEALCKVLRQYFGVPVQVHSHIGQWLGIEVQERSRLGCSANRLERHAAPAAQLSRSANAGSRVWDRQYRFRLQLGPLGLDQYSRFLPGATAWQPLQQWLGLLASPHMQCDIELRLHPEQRPEPRLGRTAARLGVSTWLGGGGGRNGPAGRHAAEPATLQRRHPQHLRIRPTSSFLLRRQSLSAAPASPATPGVCAEAQTAPEAATASPPTPES